MGSNGDTLDVGIASDMAPTCVFELDKTLISALEHENNCKKFSLTVGNNCVSTSQKNILGSHVSCISVSDFLAMRMLNHASNLLFNVDAADMQSCMEHYFELKKETPGLSACFVVAKGTKGSWRKFLKCMPLLHNFLRGTRNDQGMKLRKTLSIFKDCPQRGRLSAFGEERELTMCFIGCLGGQRVKVALDSQASHSFMNSSLLKSQYFKVDEIKMDVKLGNQSVASTSGMVKSKLLLGSFASRVQLHLLPLNNDFDIILGDDWLTQNKAILDFDTGMCKVKKGSKTHSLRRDTFEDIGLAVTTKVANNGKSSSSPGVFSTLQLKHVIKGRGSAPFA